jgi:hypothetical protein
MSNAHKTAIVRNKLSAPAQWLKDNGYLVGTVLDYGCGRGGDAERLGCAGYDPYYFPQIPRGLFTTVMCNFVLNVIESEGKRLSVLWCIDSYLERDGRAYIAVRNDKRALNGRTKLGTWQGLITLDLPIVRKCAGYVIYEYRKGDAARMDWARLAA